MHAMFNVPCAVHVGFSWTTFLLYSPTPPPPLSPSTLKISVRFSLTNPFRTFANSEVFLKCYIQSPFSFYQTKGLGKNEVENILFRLR